MKYLKWIMGIPLLLVLVVFTHYTLPGRDVVQIVGTDVKRMDVGSSALFWASQDAGTNASSTRDVRFINAVWPNGKPRVYRNEDTDWNWPPYLKFDSGNITAQAQALAKQEDSWVAITHYGWRFEWFTIFPNIISIKQVSGPDVFLVPWFNILFFAVLGALGIGVFGMVRRFKRKRVDPIVDNIDQFIDDVGDNVEKSHQSARANITPIFTRIKKWFRRWFGAPKG